MAAPSYSGMSHVMLTQVHVSLVCAGEMGGEGIPEEGDGGRKDEHTHDSIKSATVDDLYPSFHQTDR